MILEDRVRLLARLGRHLESDDAGWLRAEKRASAENGWFIPEFVGLAVKNSARYFLNKDALEQWADFYDLGASQPIARNVGIVMAGNIPLVGFHDLLCVFVAGHRAIIKPSSRDKVLIEELVKLLNDWNPEISQMIQFSDVLKNCDAYIATGSNNTSRYFEYYFGKYPHVIRRNKTSVAVLTGHETTADLDKLSDDVYQFFGLGCRNVTKLFVPRGYDFRALLEAFSKYNYLADHHKYRNNYDYNLALHILNNKFYMTNGSVLLVEEPSNFSPISQLNFEYYAGYPSPLDSLCESEDIQCIVAAGKTPFGHAQCPGLFDYADGADTMAFLSSL